MYGIEMGGHPLLWNHNMRFRWQVQVVQVPLLISFFGVTPSIPLRDGGGGRSQCEIQVAGPRNRGSIL